LYTVKNLSKFFYEDSWKALLSRNEVKALDNLDFSFFKNESIGILGRNGSGKSTLLKILGNILTADSGRLSYEYQSVETSYISGNERSFFWRLTVKENLEFFAKMYCINKNEEKILISELANELEFTRFLNVKFMALSSGFKKKISIARALMKNPEIFLFDEITNSLDITSKKKIKEIIKNFHNDQNGKVLFWASHDVQEALEVCNRILILQQGKIVISLKKGDDDFNERNINQYL